MSDSLQHHGLYYAWLLCPPLSSRVCSNSCPLSQWCYLRISSPTVRFFCLQCSPAWESFPMNQLFASKYWRWPLLWPKCWHFSFNNSPSNEYSGLIFFRIDWFGLLAVQRALKNILQHHNSKVSTLQHSALFVVQLSHLYITTGKTLALTIQTFVNKVMSAFYCGRAIIVNMTSVCQACALQMDMPWNSFHVSVNQVHVNSSWTDLWLDLLLGS